MIALRAPVCFAKDVHVSLRASAPLHPDAAKYLSWVSCPPHVVPRVISCLENSGRYDCCISQAAYDASCHDLPEVGIAVLMLT